MSESSEYLSILKPMLEKEEKLQAELDAVRRVISGIRAAAQAAGPVGIAQVAGSASDKKPVIKPSIFDGMAQPEMASRAIEFAGKALTAREILKIWTEQGAPPTGKQALTKVQNSLKRREEKVGDVTHVGDGKWALVEWYSASELKEIRSNIDGANARDRQHHRKKMVEGIEAVKARGAHYGRAPRMTEELWNAAVKMTAEGKSWKAIHSALAEMMPEGEKPISYPLIVNYREKFIKGEEYPERWRRYFESLEASKGKNAKVRLVK